MNNTTTAGSDDPVASDQGSDPQSPIAQIYQRLRTSQLGLSSRDAARRLISDGTNEIVRRGSSQRLKELGRQFTHPLALLLAAAAALSLANHAPLLAGAITAVIILNALLAFTQELQAENAVEALAAFLPPRARVLRDGARCEIDARELVPGDVLLIEEGDRVCADGRLINGALEMDLSTLNGESMPVIRSAESPDISSVLLEARDLVFSGTTCTGGEGRAVVIRTGMSTELGRIAALSERTVQDKSPLEQQVKRVAWLIGIVALGGAVAFLPLGAAAGLSIAAAISFSVGLLVANVPEGLLPTITLALAVGVRDLAKRGAVVKRLSSVETLGSTTVICTDKTGTLTQNRMQATLISTSNGVLEVEKASTTTCESEHSLVTSAATCTTGVLAATSDGSDIGDPTEIALLKLARDFDCSVNPDQRDHDRLALFHFDPHLKRMSTIDRCTDGSVALNVKGAPEMIAPICAFIEDSHGVVRPISEADRMQFARDVASYAAQGLRILAIAQRQLDGSFVVPTERDDVERDLCLLGFVALVDPPRPEVRAAIERAHRAGVRIHVVTGDNGLTAGTIAQQVGIGSIPQRVITGEELAALSESELDVLLSTNEEIIFARSSPEAKLRITDALRGLGEVVAVTGDGVNDAPALRRADIGVAMGRSGTDVAREAATMVLTDDNFATIVAAIEGGRRVYDNVRKFIEYIFTHAVPEVAPFLVFALSGGSIPLPLTVMQILAIDLGTDTLPALALSRERAEPGLMDRPPRRRSESVIVRSMLWRSWGFMGVISGLLVLGGFFLALHQGNWHLHAPTGVGSPLHHVYQQATTVAWLGIVACQIGTAFAVRAERASLRAVGFFTNRLLLGAIAMAIAFAFMLIYTPQVHRVFGTAALSPGQLLIVLPFPFIVWESDEIRRAVRRQRTSQHRAAFSTPAGGGGDQSAPSGDPVEFKPREALKLNT